MIVLKHLARKYDLEPYKIRVILRKKAPKSDRTRWKWAEGSPELSRVETILSDYAEKRRGKK